MYVKTAIIIVSIILLLGIVIPVSAQGISNGTAIGVQLNEKVLDGDIVTSTNDGYKRATSPYDPQIFGVVSFKPAVYLSDASAANNTPIISDGEVVVRISSVNGNIKAGDLITSSKIPGVGQKATNNGYIIGSAKQDYSSNNPKKVGLIHVTLSPHFAQVNNNITHNIFNAVTLGWSAAFETPLGVVRYFIAGIITMLSFFFGFRFFARASNRGVEAIGRNPLAKQAILLSVFINTIITIVIMFFGVAISYLILVL